MNEMDATTVAHALGMDFATTIDHQTTIVLERPGVVYGFQKFILRPSGRR